MNSKIWSEKNNDVPAFLRIQNPPYKYQHYEVTDFSICTIKCKYEQFSDYEFKHSYRRRNQMTSPGAYLKNPNPLGIDIVGDIITSPRYLDFQDDDQKYIFELIYHSAGNIFPIPEGANAAQKGKDVYYDKLVYRKRKIEELMNGKSIISSDEKEIVDKRLRDGITLGSIRNKYHTDYPAFTDNIVLRYWLQKCWDEKAITSWKQYVEANYLIDYVNEQYEIRELCVDELIRAIIKRGLRIFDVGNMEEELDDSVELVLVKLKKLSKRTVPVDILK